MTSAPLRNNDLETLPTTPVIDVDRVRAAPLTREPFEYFIVSDFVRPEWQEQMIADYPVIKAGGSFPLGTIKHNANFAKLIAEMDGPDFRRAIAEKFGVNLEGKPTMFTVRGRCREKDGKIHTDSESKIITVLLYMNPAWDNSGGRLRLLRDGKDIDNVITEIPPKVGTLLVFKRSTNSWHGHLPFDGERKVIQMNWVTEQKYVDEEQRRHRWSHLMKKIGLSR